MLSNRIPHSQAVAASAKHIDFYMTRTGGQILINALRNNGAEVIFGVPGESYLAALDALHDTTESLRFITARQEGGAAFMAAAYSDATGKPGICFVTRGPGATNASVGIHTAQQGSTPLILLIGQVPTDHRDREAFQEIDYKRHFGHLVKWVAEVEDAARLPEYVNRAFRVATSGRPGPVALALPENMLASTADTADLPPASETKITPSTDEMLKISDLLREAERPLLLIGGTCWSETGHSAVIKFAEDHGLPVSVGFRRQGLFPHNHPQFIGNLGFGGQPMPNDYARSADLIIALGARLNDGTTLKFSLIEAPRPKCKLIHILPGPEELGRLYQADMIVTADPNSAACALAELPLEKKHTFSEVRSAYLKMRELPVQPGPVDMAEVMRVLNSSLPANTTMTTGAGNAADWPNIHYDYRQFLGALAPISGAMGMGVPAAVAAKIARPDAPAVYIGGDGDFLMNGQELATAVQYNLDPLFIIIDNGMYGTIRANQERAHPGRVVGTKLNNPDFAAIARGYGAHGERVEATEEFGPAMELARGSQKAAVIHVLVGPDHLGPNLTVSSLQQG